MTLNLKGRQAIDIKLIELVQAHVILYDEKNSDGNRFAVRSKLWDEIGEELNEKFNLKRTADEWKARWRMLRRMHTAAVRTNTGKRSIVVEALEFLRPYKRSNTTRNTRRTHGTRVSDDSPVPTNDEQQADLVEPEPSSQTLSAHSVPNDPVNRSAIVGNWINGMNFSPMLNRETIEQNDSCYEIYYEDDGPMNNSIESPAPTASYFPAGPNPIDLDGDVAFATVIISELQKMPPHIKRQFKRNVTQMLFG